MQTKINKLMEDYGVTFGELAMRLGVSKQTLTRKISGSTEWTYNEIMILADIFNIEDIKGFFFGDK